MQTRLLWNGNWLTGVGFNVIEGLSDQLTQLEKVWVFEMV